ncbi:Rieske 2Fe-2S domain-containing protein [Gluconacetobacter azotocaptans]|uniref:aromatic ring-hydroxylating oxygenase subunit alpha n=1 Tax=Gluconacetobacter azotocaptans TaxID=142834 RepID=UPI0019592DDF|nr:Rieske 2Fe-2S domain-containing protein [Gluconacetobacter azotocaptans]MBM9403566.1 Rieske 2Fe-2S domain-containing protein [Gluconacetobacter azotocaptans]
MAPEIDSYLVRTCWHLVAHRRELCQDRDFLRLEWALGELVLYNDKGEIIAFDNICPHRGARFFTEDAGNAPVLCAYHGWSYRGGKLRVPRPEAYRTCDLESVRLNRFRTEWCGDFLFVAIEPLTDLQSQLGDLVPVLTGMSRDIDRRRNTESYRYECPWRVAVENALEPDHVHMVHPDTLGTLDLDAGQNDYYDRNSVLRASIGNEHILRGLNRISRLFDVESSEKSYTAIFLFPFSFLSSTFGYTYSLQNFFPSRGGADTHFTTRLFSANLSGSSREAIAAPFFESVSEMNRAVFAEDHAICRRIAPEFSLDASDRILSSSEEKVAHFRASVMAAELSRLSGQ